MSTKRLVKVFGPVGEVTVKVYWDSDTEEFQVRFWCGSREQKGAEYFTPEQDDAMGTAEAEIERVAKMCGEW